MESEKVSRYITGKVRGKKTNFVIPDISGLMHCTLHETLFVFGCVEGNKDYRQCIGLGRVGKVLKGDDLDIVYMNFGRRYGRQIIVKHNHARRQIYTLKKGNLAWFYGYYKVYKKKDGIRETVFFAKGFQGWYVPKALDIKNYDLDSIEQIEKENEIDMTNFIDELLEENDE